MSARFGEPLCLASTGIGAPALLALPLRFEPRRAMAMLRFGVARRFHRAPLVAVLRTPVFMLLVRLSAMSLPLLAGFGVGSGAALSLTLRHRPHLVAAAAHGRAVLHLRRLLARLRSAAAWISTVPMRTDAAVRIAATTVRIAAASMRISSATTAMVAVRVAAAVAAFLGERGRSKGERRQSQQSERFAHGDAFRKPRSANKRRTAG